MSGRKKRGGVTGGELKKRKLWYNLQHDAGTWQKQSGARKHQPNSNAGKGRLGRSYRLEENWQKPCDRTGGNSEMAVNLRKT